MNDIDWLCKKCKSNRVEIFGGVLRRSKAVDMPIKVWSIQNPEEAENQCIDCDNQGYMYELIESHQRTQKHISDAIIDEIVALAERGDHKLPPWDDKNGECPKTHPDYMGFIQFARECIRQHSIDYPNQLVKEGYAMWFEERDPNLEIII